MCNYITYKYYFKPNFMEQNMFSDNTFWFLINFTNILINAVA